MQMLGAAMLIGADHAALEDREHTFNGVRIHVATSVFLATMVDSFMAGELFTNVAKFLMFVGHQIRFGRNVLLKCTLHASKVLAGDMRGANLSAAASTQAATKPRFRLGNGITWADVTAATKRATCA